MASNGTPVNTSGHLSLRSISKHFGRVVAVDSVNLDIAKGEFLTLLGPSGSGKTTTLMMIAGFEEPTSGTIELEGKVLNYLPSYRRGFGMVFQSYALFPHMSVADNIAFPLKMRRVSATKRREMIERALNLARLGGYGDRYPNQLSGGQQQRVALARALVFNPPVLLMDEPLGALDKKLREQMQLEIKRIQEQVGITTIYVTHDQEEALVMSDRIAVMSAGRLEQVDVPSNLYKRPATRFVAEFIGESNLIPVTVTRVDGHWEGRTVGDHVVRVSARETAATEGAANVVVRPEEIQFVEEGMDVDNVFTGTVREMIYVGDTTKYEVVVAEGLSLSVKRQNRANQCSYMVGETVRVGWRADDGSLV
jgi:putative spermidine/putrescine transport system ATP-binding protein